VVISATNRVQRLFFIRALPADHDEREVRTMNTADNSQRPDDHVSRRAPVQVDSGTRVNVALPFSQFKIIQEPSGHLLALTALVEDLADLLAGAVPGPQAEVLRRRAHELASQVR
jgi:hypothetical protein